MTSLLIRKLLVRNSCPSITTTAIKRTYVKEESDLSLLNPDKAKEAKRSQSHITIRGESDISPITGIPEEHIKGRKVRIYEPVKNCMQSGTDNIGGWEMEFDNRERWENPLMGWSSTGDPMSNVKMQFPTQEEAIAYCEKNGWQWFLQENVEKPMRVKPYAIIYSWNKRTRASTK